MPKLPRHTYHQIICVTEIQWCRKHTITCSDRNDNGKWDGRNETHKITTTETPFWVRAREDA